MTPKFLLTSLHALTVMLSTTAAYAEDSRVRMLEQTVKQRDQVIIELLERVETLERRVGVDRPTAGTAETQQPGAVPAAENDLTENTVDAPGRVIVKEGAAERALERSLTRAGALLLPSGVIEVEPGLIYVRQEDAAPGFIMTGDGFAASETERNVDNLAADLALRMGLPWDSQLEIGIPYRWRQVESVSQIGFVATGTSSESASGWGDVRIGIAKTLLREGRRRPDLVGRITWDTDSGNRQHNSIALGDGFNQLRASLTAIKTQDPIAFVGGLSYEHVLENDQLQPGQTMAANFGGFIALSPETSLRLGLAVAYQDETELSGGIIDGSDRIYGTLVLGGSTLLAPGMLLNLSAGIGLTDDADDFSLMVSLPVRLSGRLY